MGLMKYPVTPSGRSVINNNYLTFKDVCILEHNTSGHTIFNFGDFFRDNLYPRMDGVYSSSIKELDLILGDSSSLNNPILEIINDGYRNMLLSPTAIGEVIGTDYEYLSSTIEDTYDSLNAFTVKCPFSASFKEGEKLFYKSLIKFLELYLDEELPVKEGTMSIIGGRNTYINHKKHQLISNSLLKDIGLETKFSIFDEDVTLSSLKNLITSEIIIYTSLSCLPLIEFLKDNFDKKAYYLSSLDEDSYKVDLSNIFSLINKEPQNDISPYEDVYPKVFNIFRNILSATTEEFSYVLYLDEDNLVMFKKLFDNLNIENLDIKYYLNHDSTLKEGTQFPYISSDEFIDTICLEKKDKNTIFISSDIISPYVKNNVEVEIYNSTYHLLTPIDKPYSLNTGLYKIAKEISKIII